MRVFRFLTFVAGLASALAVQSATNAVLVSADGAEAKVALAKVQNIAVVNEGKATMTANLTDGVKKEGLTKVMFVEGDGSGMKQALVITDAVSIYPNPVSEKLFVSGAGDNPKVSVIDMSGRVVLSTVGNEVVVSDLESGMYIIRVNGEYARFIKK